MGHDACNRRWPQCADTESSRPIMIVLASCLPWRLLAGWLRRTELGHSHGGPRRHHARWLVAGRLGLVDQALVITLVTWLHGARMRYYCTARHRWSLVRVRGDLAGGTGGGRLCSLSLLVVGGCLRVSRRHTARPHGRPGSWASVTLPPLYAYNFFFVNGREH